jgi:hypothetical protein
MRFRAGPWGFLKTSQDIWGKWSNTVYPMLLTRWMEWLHSGTLANSVTCSYMNDGQIGEEKHE